ncbi:MAG: aspartate aminotransferase family protein [Defluviitaleaceae bacterium]|nr:aspartate aminotransferase family protein [Defluviitaleaceae bacterium]
MKNYNEIKAMHDENILPTYPRYPVAFAKGAGCRLWDTEGKEYIDFASGIGVNAIGHSHPKWVEAVSSQAGILSHVSNLYYTQPSAELAEKLCTLSGMKGVFFCNSGAESNEGVIKTARKYSNDKYGVYGAVRHTIITLEGSFHGRTMATLTATGQEKFHKHFHPFVEGFRYVPANDISALEAQGNDVCALLLEPIQGEGGVMPLDRSYLQAAAELCKQRDWLLITDEIQTGIGRTGEWFAFQNYGVTPDVVSFAKGIAGGLPLGGFMLGEKAQNTLSAGDHGTTYGGNLVCCTAALAVLEVLEPVLPSVKEKGAYICEKIAAMELPQVVDIRGMGLMIGIKLEGVAHTAVVAKLLEAGLVALPAGADVLRFLPPLTIDMDDINAGLAILENVFRSL